MFKQAMMASVVVLASAGVHAAGATLTVSGTITPEACTVSLGNNGNVDYGNLSVSTVKGYDRWFYKHYSLPMKRINLNVSCPSATRVGISVVDNRAASKDVTLPNPDIKFGLGLAGATDSTESKEIGFFEIGTHAVHLQSTRSAAPTDAAIVLGGSGTGNWVFRSPYISATYLSQNMTLAFSMAPGASRTADITPTVSLTAELEVAPKILITAVENARAPIKLDGSAMLTVMYE